MAESLEPVIDVVTATTSIVLDFKQCLNSDTFKLQDELCFLFTTSESCETVTV